MAAIKLDILLYIWTTKNGSCGLMTSWQKVLRMLKCLSSHRVQIHYIIIVSSNFQLILRKKYAIDFLFSFLISFSVHNPVFFPKSHGNLGSGWSSWCFSHVLRWFIAFCDKMAECQRPLQLYNSKSVLVASVGACVAKCGSNLAQTKCTFSIDLVFKLCWNAIYYNNRTLNMIF